MINNVNITFLLHVKDGTKMINFSCTLISSGAFSNKLYSIITFYLYTRIIMITRDYILLYYYYYLLLIINNNKLTA